MDSLEQQALLERDKASAYNTKNSCAGLAGDYTSQYETLAKDLVNIPLGGGETCSVHPTSEMRVTLSSQDQENPSDRAASTVDDHSTHPHRIVPTVAETDSKAHITTKIYAAGICCPSEVPIIHNVLQHLPGVYQVDVAVVTRAVTVRHSPSLTCPSTLVAALNEAHLEASLTFPRQQSRSGRSWIPPPHVLASLALFLLSLISYLAAPTGVHFLWHLRWLSIAAVVVGVWPIALKAWGALKSKSLDIHSLVVIAVVGSIALGEFSEAAAVVVLFSIADFLEERCSGQARDAITAVLSLRPDSAVLAAGGAEVAVDGVAAGTRVVVRPGAKVPLDGRVEKGASKVDESLLTGEAAAVPKAAGDDVCAGTVNVGGGTLEVVTTAAAGDSAVARMAALVEKATAASSPTEALVTRFAKYYTPAVVAACVCVALVPWLAGLGNYRRWVYLSLQLLVTACPCALVISTPVTVVSAVARAAGMGALVKGGVHLETLSKVAVMTFDKTGTLTLGSFRLLHCQLGTSPHPSPLSEGEQAGGVHGSGGSCPEAAGGMREGEVLRLVGSLERGASHPLAAAILGRAAAQGISCDAPVQLSTQIPGCGLEGEVEGHALVVGTYELLASRQVQDGPEGGMERAREQWGQKGVTLCLVAVDGVYAGCIAAQDAPRPEAAEAVWKLEGLGVQAAILTGDARGGAKAVGEAVGVAPGHVHASLLPRDKLDLVAAYQQRSDQPTLVAHVGDGVNDAPALAAADVGIAMGVAGAAAAVEAGDVALFSNDLRLLPALVELSRRARGKILENITLAVVSKVAVLALASLDMFTLWGAVAVDVGSALVVTLNGVSLLYWRAGQYGCGTDRAALGPAHGGHAACGEGGVCSGHGHGGKKESKGGCCAGKGGSSGGGACCGPRMAVKDGERVGLLAGWAAGSSEVHAAPCCAAGTACCDLEAGGCTIKAGGKGRPSGEVRVGVQLVAVGQSQGTCQGGAECHVQHAGHAELDGVRCGGAEGQEPAPSTACGHSHAPGEGCCGGGGRQGAGGRGGKQPWMRSW